MKIHHPLLTKTLGLVVTSLLKRWMDTLDAKWVLYDRAVDPALDCGDRRRIYVFWHEYILLPLDRMGHRNYSMLLSRHRDADVLARIAGHLGYGTVRGSTFDGGSTSLRELIRTARTSHLAITPDGPRGPRRRLEIGPVYLASKLGMPIVPMGYGYDRPWRINSWDKFAVPRPYSRVRAIYGPEIYLPRKLDRDGLEHHRREIERMIDVLTTDAERWAESDERRAGELPYRRDILRRGQYLPDPTTYDYAQWRRHEAAAQAEADSWSSAAPQSRAA
jgi:lysophospholipid acyltransferase (LPLAT)-like uncharacterized protein